jgi:hypothetical protein
MKILMRRHGLEEEQSSTSAFGRANCSSAEQILGSSMGAKKLSSGKDLMKKISIGYSSNSPRRTPPRSPRSPYPSESSQPLLGQVVWENGSCKEDGRRAVFAGAEDLRAILSLVSDSYINWLLVSMHLRSSTEVHSMKFSLKKIRS